MGGSKTVVTVLTSLSVPLCARASSPFNNPYFPNGPYDITVVVPPGGTGSFTISDIVRDDDPEDTIVYMNATAGPFFGLTFTPGNPASFIYYGQGFTYNEVGSVFGLGIGARDNSPFMNSGGTTVTVRVFPEPSLVALGVAGISIMCKRPRVVS